MTDAECVAFLQWALPRLRLRWPGFRKVRRTVCKRIDARLRALGLSGAAAYRAHLEAAPPEWAVLEGLCGITISRFYRDRGVFDFLGDAVLPELARAARARGAPRLAAWSIGCASGEEPYTLMLIWRLRVQPLVPDVDLRVLATDVDAAVLERARAGCYGWSSLKDLPAEWPALAFERAGDRWCLRPAFRAGVELLRQDVRTALPEETFDLVLCRNLVCTYFDEPLQRATFARVLDRLGAGGGLVIGKGERLPAGAPGLAPWSAPHGVYRRVSAPVAGSQS
jgi:chemotaxis protein methyltransferase CheR